MSYFDGTNSVLIAQLTNSTGEVVGNNQVVYSNAFVGVDADLLYTYTKAGFEQDIVLREQPPTPESFGLNSTNTRLQVLTEFFNPPQPTVITDAVPTPTGNLTDDNLNFGTMAMMPGKAFLLGTNTPAVVVNKEWVLLDGRQFLVEEVPVTFIADELGDLPLQQTTSTQSNTPLNVVSTKRLLPMQRIATLPGKHPMQMAKTTTASHGLVLDYQAMLVQTNYNNTFQADTTYYISGTVTLAGTNIFEGGSVFKYTNSGTAKIILSTEIGGGDNSWIFKTGPYHPVIFTSMNDNSVGDTISGSTGSPSINGSSTYLDLQGDNGYPAYPIQNARFSYAGTAIYQEDKTYCAPIKDCQFLNCNLALGEAVYSVEPGYTPVQEIYNVLMSHCSVGVQMASGYPLAVDGENMTVDHTVDIMEVVFSTISGAYTNCIFTSINYSIFYIWGSGSVTYDDCSTSESYQTAGGGNYYLATDSANRNAGTTNINSTLLADLQQKTINPPQIYSDPFGTNTSNVTFGPLIARDTNATPSRGYHYDPLDYALGGVEPPDTIITVTNGAAIGFFNYLGWCIYLGGSAQFISQGTANSPNQLVEYSTVQESAYGNKPSVFLEAESGGSINCQFTDFSIMANDAYSVETEFSTPSFNFEECQFQGGQVYELSSGLSFFNCLFDRVGVQMSDGGDLSLAQSLLWNGSVTFSSGGSYSVYNTAFDGTAITNLTSSSAVNHNAYINSTYVSIDFTNGNGTYTVEVGLKGYATNSQQTWLSDSLIYLNPDNIPLILTETNPASSTVTMPMIQLEGMVSKSLSQLTYDVSNALGVVTNQNGYWYAAFYDTNVLAFTTNSFQCYDVPLTNGLNVITLHAFDLAGNETTTNFSYTLDYSGDTNAPQLQLVWPLPNASIDGTNFTLQATVNDDTATVTATITDTNGDTNMVSALVERNGNTWVNNLPLAAGTNNVTLAAINAAGNLSTTNFNVVQSAVSLTIDPINDQLNQATVDVTGTVTPGEKVWVNGTSASVDGSGNWEADGVPVSPYGMANLTIQTGAATNDIDGVQTLDQVQTPAVTVAAYTRTLRFPDWGYNTWCNGTGPEVYNDDTTHWISGIGSDVSSASSWVDDCGHPPFTNTYTTDLSGYTNDLPVTWENVNAFVTDPDNGTSRLNIQTTLAIKPSGQGQVGTTSTYLVLMSALEYSVDNIEDPLYIVDNFLGALSETPISPEQLQINGQALTDIGITNDNGSTWGSVAISEPSGAQVTLKPSATLANPNDDAVFQSKVYQLVSQCEADYPENKSRTNIGVGELVDLSISPEPPTNVTWSTTAGSFNITNEANVTLTAPSNTANVTVTLKIGNATDNIYFKVYAPTGYASAVIGSTATFGEGVSEAEMFLDPVVIGPTDVSFENVYFEEVGEDATNISGYYITNPPPSHIGHGADQWFQPVNYNEINNTFSDECDSGMNASPWSNGSYTWPIPVAWEVGGTNIAMTNLIVGWSQVFTIDTNGTVTIQKFGRSVTRTIQNVITTQ